MKKSLLYVLVCVLLVSLLSSCGPEPTNRLESRQQEAGVMSLIQNQPVPDLGGYSFERQIVIETYLARNRTISTYAYMFTMDGKVVEICPSIGYPIPYSTQLTAPERREPGLEAVIPQSEPNGLYPPGDAAATLVQCVNKDGSVTPVYIEWYVLAFPYRIQSDLQLVKIGEPSFSVEVDQ
jgi:hypothetical protein